MAAAVEAAPEAVAAAGERCCMWGDDGRIRAAARAWSETRGSLAREEAGWCEKILGIGAEGGERKGDWILDPF